MSKDTDSRNQLANDLREISDKCHAVNRTLCGSLIKVCDRSISLKEINAEWKGLWFEATASMKEIEKAARMVQRRYDRGLTEDIPLSNLRNSLRQILGGIRRQINFVQSLNEL